MVVRQKEGVKEGSEIPPKMFRIGLLERGGGIYLSSSLDRWGCSPTGMLSVTLLSNNKFESSNKSVCFKCVQAGELPIARDEENGGRGLRSLKSG